LPALITRSHTNPCALYKLAADYILDHPDDFLPFLIAEEELPPQGLKKYCDEVLSPLLPDTAIWALRVRRKQH
jgi:hypothetical protein